MSNEARSNVSDVAQPADGLQLAELNQRSAMIGSWHVGIFNPKISEWTFTDKTSKKEKQGAAFRCLLVCLQDHSQYVTREIPMANQKMKPLTQAMTKFEKNKCFRMSAVKFKPNTQQEFLQTPQKFIVNMSSTKFDPIMSTKDGETIQPEPSMNLSLLNDLQQNQRFDVTALVENVGNPISLKSC